MELTAEKGLQHVAINVDSIEAVTTIEKGNTKIGEGVRIIKGFII